jgi:xanthosine utilization system XapX-like protein
MVVVCVLGMALGGKVMPAIAALMASSSAAPAKRHTHIDAEVNRSTSSVTRAASKGYASNTPGTVKKEVREEKA